MTFFDRKTANRAMATALVAVCVFLSSTVAPAAQAAGVGASFRRAADITFDVVVLRPFWALTLATGCVMLAPVSLLASPGGLDAIRDAKEVFFDRPYKQTVERPLGEL